jgi:hypothetical protein
MTEQIKPADYPKWLEIIRSEQIPSHKVPRLLKDNPAFAEWWREKMGNPITDLIRETNLFDARLQACSWCGELHPQTDMVYVETEHDNDFYCSLECLEQDLTKGRGKR